MGKFKNKVQIIMRYWQTVILDAWHTAMEKSNLKGFTIAVLGALIIFGCLLLLSYIGILPENWNIDIAIGNFNAEVQTQLIYWVGAGVATLIIFLFSIVYIPAKIHESQEQIIDEQGKKISPTVKLELTQYRPEAGDNGVRWAGVYIQNKSGIHSIEQCKAKLLSFTPEVRGINNLPSDLMWSDNNRPDSNGFLVIPRDGKVSLDVAVSASLCFSRIGTEWPSLNIGMSLNMTTPTSSGEW